MLRHLGPLGRGLLLFFEPAPTIFHNVHCRRCPGGGLAGSVPDQDQEHHIATAGTRERDGTP